MMRPLRELAEALRLDFDWLREHTRLGELAARWQSRNRPDALLLRGDDLDAAKAWVAKRKPAAPEITELRRAFLSASERAEIARLAESKAARGRTRRTRILVGALAAVIVLGFAAYWNEYGLKLLYHWFSHVRGSVLTAEAERTLKPGETFRECVKIDKNYSKFCPEMVVVPAGKFVMGSPATEKDRATDEGPQHEVAITRPFAVSKFEVTQGQWDTCVQYGPCKLITPVGSVTFANFPVTLANFYDASLYAEWLSFQTGKQYRLLSEAEWEYAARAGSTSPYSFEGDASALDQYAWYKENSEGTERLVGKKNPNAFGLYDMHGNVWEWVEDCYHQSYDGAPADGSAWTFRCDDGGTGAVVRGGSWTDEPRNLRSASRLGKDRFETSNRNLGFRVGRTLTP